jgi:hypothetical protein
MIKKYIPFIIALIFVVIHYCFGNNNSQIEAKENYIYFNKGNLKDKLIGIDYYARGVKLIFKKDRYIFYPISSSLNDNIIFEGIAEAGDSIYKKPLQKILTLKKKNGKEYKFSFREF